MSTVRIYACGGTGIAIGKKVSNLTAVKGAAIPKMVFCDTSMSDMRVGFEKLDKFVLSNVDGAGKRQGEHIQPIRKEIPALLENHPPEALNIIISSSSGGTGPAFTVELAKQLLSEGHPVIVQLVVTREDSRASQNSINTLKLLNRLAAKSELPVVVSLVHQDNASDELESDDKVLLNIATLAIIGGGHSNGLDTQDIQNFVFFDRVTSVKPRLLLLELLHGELSDKDLERDDVITLIEVTPSEGAPSNMGALYRASGEGISDKRLTAITHMGDFPALIESLELHLMMMNERLAKVETPAIKLDDMDEDDIYNM